MQNEWWKVNSWLMFACGVWHYKLLFSDDLCKSSDPLLTLTYKPIPSLSPLLTSPLAEFFYRDRNVSSRLDCQPQQPIPSLRDSNPYPSQATQAIVLMSPPMAYLDLIRFMLVMLLIPCHHERVIVVTSRRLGRGSWYYGTGLLISALRLCCAVTED